MPNGTKSACNYEQVLQPGQTYYVYNEEYPGYYKGENHCTYRMRSQYMVNVKCDYDMGCYGERLSIQFDNNQPKSYCGYNSFNFTGMNPTIYFDSSYNSQGGKFLCEIISLSNNCNCGWKKVTRIVGGEETGVNEFPMMSGLVNINDGSIYCGATIISNQFVLTAAHCLERRNMNEIGVVVGEHDPNRGDDTRATKLFKMLYYRFHPGYNEVTGDNDVAICKIDGFIQYSAEVGPVCLPFQHSLYTFDGSIVTALGWGLLEFAGSKSNTLQKVNLNVQNCPYQYATENHICTYTPGKDSCQMDSGGPLLWQDPSTHRLVLAGIISAGVGCASDSPSVGMRVGAYINWIKTMTPDVEYCQAE